MKDKIKTRQEIEAVVSQLRKKGKKIVAINGSFDLLHVGHIRLLQEAKGQGDVLIVGLNSDSSVREWKKLMNYKDWASRPLIPQDYRAEMLAALESVDYVTIFDEPNPIPLLEVIKPDVFVNGADYGENCIEAQTVRRHGGRVHIVKLYEGFSTSKLIRKIVDLHQQNSSKV
jgi:rfaE bifunctional protein nucleotidyltransferase chain/domain